MRLEAYLHAAHFGARKQSTCTAARKIRAYNARVPFNPLQVFIHFAFVEFYNRFAFTYDTVSKIVSRGEWRAWTRAAIPFLRGKRILEIAFGTGDLHLDLYDAGFIPFGIDLSPYMCEITTRKFRARGLVPRLTRADVCALPFPDNYFSSLVMTFPPGFIFNPTAMSEMRRVLEPEGVLVWVDAAEMDARTVWDRMINSAFAATGTGVPLDARIDALKASQTNDAAWMWRIERVALPTSHVHVFIATKK
jgi:ubiquinone/menaquinone biosynthesis C-methylase UbiE